MEIQYSHLKINHLKDTPSTKAAGGGIYSGVLLKDVKVPVKVRRTLSSVGTSSSNRFLSASMNYIACSIAFLPIILSSIALSTLGAAIKGATSFSSQENHLKH
jgi:hypothetical protein